MSHIIYIQIIQKQLFCHLLLYSQFNNTDIPHLLITTAQYSIDDMKHISFRQPLIDKHLGCVQFLIIVNSPAMNVSKCLHSLLLHCPSSLFFFFFFFANLSCVILKSCPHLLREYILWRQTRGSESQDKDSVGLQFCTLFCTFLCHNI